MFDPNDPITLTRDCEAILIPQGTPISLTEGFVVYIVQALGGSVTVNANGNLARIAGRDLDAVGMEPEAPLVTSENPTIEEIRDLAWSQLKSCYDPEIPINIVDLGLIYDCTVQEAANGINVRVEMTLTAPGCGMGEFLVEDVRSKLQEIPKVEQIDVELVFEPMWDQTMMSDAARLQVGLY